MNFSIVAAFLSLAAFAVAAPIATGTSTTLPPPNPYQLRPLTATPEIDARQNHGMCVKSNAGTVEEIANC
jgi:hypothetical protein